MNSYLLQTNRLRFRSLLQEDLEDIFEMFGNSNVMRFYPSTYTKEQTEKWLLREIDRAQKNKHGMLAVELITTGEFVGAIGLTLRLIDGKTYNELAYMIKEKFWHKGFATEGAIAVRDFCLNNLKKEKIVSLIFDENVPSISVVKKIGMLCEEEVFIQERKYLLYSICR